MVYTLGICNGETSSACLFENGSLKFAVSEERFSRIKMDDSFPEQSVKFVLSEKNIQLNEVNQVAYSWSKGFDESLVDIYTKRSAELARSSNYSSNIFQERINVEIERDIAKRNEFWKWAEENLTSTLFNGIYSCYHHEAHAYSASLLSPFNKGVVLTSDGRGDFESATMWLFDRNSVNPLKKLYSNTSSDSLGFFYGRITGLLGFKPCRHEGKITGLAARGNPKKAIKLMEEMICFSDGCIKANLSNLFRPFYTNYSNELKERISFYSKEDIAAAAQFHLENLLFKLVNHIYKENELNGLPILLAGGVFGNVKVNQVLKEIDIVGDAFVQPQMGDGGLCLGAAAAAQHKMGLKIKSMKNLYLGPYPSKQIDKDRFKSNKSIITLKLKDPIEEIITFLKGNKVIGLVRGRMEFGPRALCHRSIIYKTSDVTANNWLNKRMKRTEFMPFAPVMTNLQAKKSFTKFRDDDVTLRYMTSTMDVNEQFKKKCPAVTHIDKTARPQVIFKEDDIFLWNLLTRWEEVSGELSLINTSFNAHEEPIICDEDDSIKALFNDVVDMLIINENFLIYKK